MLLRRHRDGCKVNLLVIRATRALDVPRLGFGGGSHLERVAGDDDVGGVGCAGPFLAVTVALALVLIWPLQTSQSISD